MKIKLNYARQLWLSILLLVGVAAIAVPGLNGTNSGNVARIGSTEYATLRDAVDAAQQMGGAVTVNIINDISGETVTIQEVPNFKLTIDGKKDASSNYTVDARIIIDGLRQTSGAGGSPSNGASVTLQNIAFVNSASAHGIQSQHYSHHVTIQNCTYSGSDNTKWFFDAGTDGPLYGVTIKNVTVEHARLIQANLSADAVFENIVATNDVYCGFNVKTGDSGGYTGTLLIKNCQVTTGKYAFRDYSDGYTGTITLEGNTFKSTSEESDEGVIVNRGGNKDPSKELGHINVVSGTYTGHVKVLNNMEGVLAISGGYFSEEFPQEYLAADLVAQGKVCTPAPDMEGYFTVGDPHYVAQIGETKYTSLAKAVEAVTAGTETTIIMIDDETIEGNAGVTIPADKNIILDLNGKTITGVVQNPSSAQTILNKGTLVITDNSADKNGTITNVVSDENAGSPGDRKNWFSNAITNNGTLTVNAGNIVNTGTGGACYAIDNITNGTLCTPVLNIEGGNISAKKVAVRMFCNSTTNDNTVNVTGGVISSENAYAIQAQQANNNANKAVLNISGGIISGKYAFCDYGNTSVSTQFDNASYNITGGFFTGYMWSYATYYCGMDGFVSGGYFSNEIGGDIVTPGSACVENTDEATMATYPYAVGLADVHYYWLDNNGNIDGGGYYTIYAPFSGPDPVLMDGEFVELQRDVTLTKDIEYLEECSFGNPIFKGGTFTLKFGEYNIDLNGHVFPIPTGVTVLTDKRTDIFSALNAGYGVVETATETGYSYTVAPYVAQIGETKYVTLADAVAAVPTDGTATTITMIADETVAANGTLTVAAGKNIVLDLNGKNISGSNNSTGNFYLITNNGTLEITDNSQEGEGKITFQSAKTDYSNERVTIYNLGGTLTLTKGTVENTTAGGLAYAINNSSNAWGSNVISTFNLNGGKVSAPSGDAALRVYQNCAAGSTLSKNFVNISGGTIDATGIFVDENLYQPNESYTGDNIETKINISGGTVNGLIDMKIRHPFNTLLNITGGDFTNTKIWVRKVASEYANVCGEPTAPMVTISGGKFDFAGDNAFGLAYDYAATTWTSYDKPYEISGGVFELAVPAEYCADGYIPANNTDEATNESYPYTVKAGQFVAQIGDNKYETLAEAVAAAGTAATTIKMIANETLTDNVVIGGTYGSSASQTTAINAQNITLDLNGFSITGEKTIYLAGGSLDITGEGTIENTGTGASPVGVRYVNSTSGLDYTSKRTLTVGENVTLKGKVYGLNIFGTNNASIANDIEVTVNGKVEGILFVLGNLTNDANNIVITVNGSVDASGIDLGAEKAKTGIALNGNAKVVVNENASVKGETAIEVRAGELTVNGGTITATSESYSYTANNSGTTVKGAAIAIAPYDAEKDLKVTVSDGTLSGAKTIAVVDVQNNLEKVTVKAKDDFVDGADETVIPESYKWVSDGEGMSTLTPRDPIAKIGETVYYSLANAIAAVPTDGTETTIELLANVTENVVVKDGKNIVLDLGGKTVTGYIDQYDSNITLTNGNLAGTFYVKGGPSSAEAGYNKFTLAADATITSDWGFILYQGPNGNDAYGSTIDINGTINGTAWVMGNITEGNSVINVNNGATIDGDVFGLNGLATLNVKAGATIIGAETGIEVRAGNLNVEGGTITSTSTEYKVESNGSGTTTYGAAIAVAQHTTGLPINANITGGTLTGLKTISVADPEGGNYAGVVVTAKDELTEKENNVIPDGYIWMSNNNGTSTLKKIEDGEYKLIDTDTRYPFMSLKSDISVSKVTYERTFTSELVDQHQAWYVPMDYTITAEDAENFTFYKLQMIAGAAEAGEADPDKMYLYVTPMNVGETLVGNRPYTVKPKSAVNKYVFKAENTILYAPNNGSRLNVTTSTHSYDFFGQYEKTTYKGKVGDFYVLSGNALHPNDATIKLRPYRWNIKVSKNNINDGYSKIEFVIVEDGDATGINSVRGFNADDVEGIYTINGMKLDEPVKGINIIKYKNGRTEKRIIK